MSWSRWRDGTLAAAAILAVSGCGSSAKLGGQGASCALVSDCEPGLVCAPPENDPNGARSCTNNPAAIVPAGDLAKEDAGDAGNGIPTTLPLIDATVPPAEAAASTEEAGD